METIGRFGKWEGNEPIMIKTLPENIKETKIIDDNGSTGIFTVTKGMCFEPISINISSDENDCN